MSAAVDYRERHKALRAKFYPAGRAYLEPPSPPKKLPVRWQFLYQKPIGPVPRDILEVSTQSFEPVIERLVPTAFEQAYKARHAVASVCQKHGMTRLELMTKSRRAEIVHARQEAIYFVRQVTTWSLPRIGDYFGGLDHTTILHAIKMHTKRMGIDA